MREHSGENARFASGYLFMLPFGLWQLAVSASTLRLGIGGTIPHTGRQGANASGH
jgi:hypothetical protein